MRITIRKGEKRDKIEAVRVDRSSLCTSFPHKGWVPHDAVHFYIESSLGIADAFWGLVAGGKHPEEIAALAEADGHASASRAAAPEVSIIGLVQAERAAECLEADLWSGSRSDPQAIGELITAGCAQSFVPPIAVTDQAIESIQFSLDYLGECWTSTGAGEAILLEWAEEVA